jgi:hypothetical protein
MKEEASAAICHDIHMLFPEPLASTMTAKTTTTPFIFVRGHKRERERTHHQKHKVSSTRSLGQEQAEAIMASEMNIYNILSPLRRRPLHATA